VHLRKMLLLVRPCVSHVDSIYNAYTTHERAKQTAVMIIVQHAAQALASRCLRNQASSQYFAARLRIKATS